jgi:hypothetical protein
MWKPLFILHCVISRQKTEKTTKSLASETTSLIKQLNYLAVDDPGDQVMKHTSLNTQKTYTVQTAW